MDGKELEIIEKRIIGTTPAPWITGSIPWQVWCDGGHGKICRVESCASDREFIAHARQDVPALLDEVRKLNLQIDALKNALYAECRGIACSGEGCYVGYRSCSGCEARAKAAFGPGWEEFVVKRVEPPKDSFERR